MFDTVGKVLAVGPVVVGAAAAVVRLLLLLGPFAEPSPTTPSTRRELQQLNSTTYYNHGYNP